jgi:hypothetical protein
VSWTLVIKADFSFFISHNLALTISFSPALASTTSRHSAEELCFPSAANREEKYSVISLTVCTSIREHCLIGSLGDGTELGKLYNPRYRNNSLWIVSEKLIKDKSVGVRRLPSLVDSLFVCISACRQRIFDRNLCTSLFHLRLRASQSDLTATISALFWATSISFCNCNAATSASPE